MSRLAPLLLLTGLDAFAGCSNLQGESPHLGDAGIDASPADAASDDALMDVGADGDGGQRACIAHGSTGIVCDQSLASYCTDGGWGDPYNGCGSLWSGVHASPPCAVAATLGNYSVGLGTCGSFDGLAVNGADWGTLFLYDPASGNLVAIEQYSPNSLRCAAGPSCLVVDDGTCGLNDACADAGAPDASGDAMARGD